MIPQIFMTNCKILELQKQLIHFMIKVYATKIDSDAITTERNEFFHKHYKKQQLIFNPSQSLKNLQGSTGNFLIRHILSANFGCDLQTLSIVLDSYGKPYCPSARQIYFSISHSDKWVVCALDCELIGIDIQKIISIPQNRMDSIVLRFFHKCEQIQYFNLADDEKKTFFFTQWTLKESYIKLMGNGLGIGLQNFSVFLDHNGNGSMDYEGSIYYFRQYIIDQNYKLVVCSLNNSFPQSIENISFPPQ